MRTILITGGSGFIGSNLIAYWQKKYPLDQIINVDCQTYAARPIVLAEHQTPPHFINLNVDIRDQAAVRRVMQLYRPDHMLHLAAESHVCRSVAGPRVFMETNIMGTYNLLEEFKDLWISSPMSHRFVHVSTDEVYGDLGSERHEKFREERQYAPTSPYAASKAASDHIAMSYFHTYGLNVVVTNCTNNFGPNQHEEKLIPRTIKKIREGNPVIVHGQGDHVRDWIFVEDHCKAIDTVFCSGETGQTYCVGGENERTNLQVIDDVFINMRHVAKDYGLFWPLGRELQLEFRDDRPTDDKRYAVDCSKLKLLGWKPSTAYHDNLRATLAWYLSHN